MSKRWFIAKRYGYGWYPATWEGWVVMGIFLAFVLCPIELITHSSPRESMPAILYIVYVFCLITILMWVCTKKGDPLGWRWGKRK
jgi:drug/metabolite transporter (DMT)-like permease